MIFTFKMICVL